MKHHRCRIWPRQKNHLRLTPGSRRQRGAETVEFLITFLFFLIVFFMIVDFAIAVYDKGAVVNASRVAMRQGTLYWADPDPNVYPSETCEFDYTNPDCYNSVPEVALQESLIASAVNIYLNVLINPGSDTVDTLFEVDGTTLNPGDVLYDRTFPGGLSRTPVTVGLTYSHDFIGLTRLLGAAGLNLQAQTTALVELDR